MAFRFLGLSVGIMLLAVIWSNSKLFGNRPPLLLLPLLGLNTTFLTWGTSIRGYGIGSLLILCVFALTAKMILEPTWRHIIAVFVASVVSVQFLLHNSVLLFAIFTGVAMVSLVRRKFRPALAMACTLLLCAASMLPYVGAYSRATQWNMLQKGPLTISLIWNQLLLAFGDPWHVMTWVWPTLFVATMVGAVGRLYLTRRKKPAFEWDLLLFGLTVSIASIIGYYAFLKALSYGTRPWYYLALLSTLAGALDLSIAIFCSTNWVRVARLVFAGTALTVLPFADWPSIVERPTNVDLIARKLERVARPNDLIVVNPWWLGISFNRYYHGATRWETLPTMNDHQIHRFDLVKAKMMSSNPVDDLRDMIGRTLQSGNRVWFAGGVDLPQPGEPRPQLPGASDSDFRWNSDVYCEFWSAQLGDFVKAHMLRTAMVAEPATGPVNPLEDVPLLGVEGWQETSNSP